MPAVISVENLSKSYHLGQIGTGTLTNDLKVWWAKMRGKPNPLSKIGQQDYGNRDGEEIWALRDVSFEVEQGEVLGIIGRNGAGKSTLLKILSRVTAPTSGQVKVKGRIASLLEVGTGFHPELTGRENIYLNGAILGMSREEVRKKFDEIVDFAEVEKFVDTPVKRYSSGMYVRLAFAVAAHLEPEILLVDEVLAVGDMEFQKKCLGKMGEAARGGRTVFFVSHNMAVVRQLCSRALLIKNGYVISNGSVENVISDYINQTNSDNDRSNLQDRKDRHGSGNVFATGIEIYSQHKMEIPPTTGGPVNFLVSYDSKNHEIVKKLYVGIIVKDKFDSRIFMCSTAMEKVDFYNIPSQGKISCKIEWLPLVPGRYSIDLKLMDVYGLSDFICNACEFNVVDNGDARITSYGSNINFVVPHKWELFM